MDDADRRALVALVESVRGIPYGRPGRDGRPDGAARPGYCFRIATARLGGQQ
jgi:hypothetical protein